MLKMKNILLSLVLLVSSLALVGCKQTNKGNFEWFFEWGTKVAIGQAVQKSDETQIATTEFIMLPKNEDPNSNTDTNPD